MGNFYLTFIVKMGYNEFMFRNGLLFVSRILLIVAVWGFIWRFVEPRTQLMRVLRAALLLLALLGILAIMKIVGADYV